MSTVMGRVIELASGPGFWSALSATVGQALAGLLVAIAVAVPLGVLTGLSRLADDLTAYAVQLLRPVPAVALIPVFILMVGTGPRLAVALGAFAATWPLLVQVRAGLADVDPVASDTARVFGLPWPARVRWVHLPSAAGHVLTGVRLAATFALVLAVTAELVAGSPGLGREITLAQSSGDTVGMYAIVVVTGILGVTLNLCLQTVERRLLAWHPAHRKDAR